MQGRVQVYTGDGKGKTTAALGLAVRAVGAGLRVVIFQFMKQGRYSEINTLERFGDRLQVHQFGTGRWVGGNPDAKDVAAAAKGIEALKGALTSGDFDLVIADEANVAAHCGLIPVDTLVSLMDLRQSHTELVITGRHAHPRVVEQADLVTEMIAVKHYFSQGVRARTGIEK